MKNTPWTEELSLEIERLRKEINPASLTIIPQALGLGRSTATTEQTDSTPAISKAQHKPRTQQRPQQGYEPKSQLPPHPQRRRSIWKRLVYICSVMITSYFCLFLLLARELSSDDWRNFPSYMLEAQDFYLVSATVLLANLLLHFIFSQRKFGR